MHAHMFPRQWASVGGCLSPAYAFTATESFRISAAQGLAFSPLSTFSFFLACQSEEVGKMMNRKQN